MKLRKQVLYLIEAFSIYSLFFLFKMMKIEHASKLGAKIALGLSKLIQENKVAKENIKMCLPSIAKDSSKITKRVWEHFGSVIGELPHWNSMSKAEFFNRVTIVNENFIPKSKAIIVSAHLGNWELIGRIAKEYNIKLNLVYRPSNNLYVNNLINKLRRTNNVKLIPKGVPGIKMMLAALQRDEVVGIMVDQKMSDGINVKFFGKSAMTTALPANLAIKYKVPIIPTYIVKTRPTNYEAKFCSPIYATKLDDKYLLTSKINSILEGWIRQFPEQWFWFHKRWK